MTAVKMVLTPGLPHTSRNLKGMSIEVVLFALRQRKIAVLMEEFKHPLSPTMGK